jgi:hypothetical protein
MTHDTVIPLARVDQPGAWHIYYLFASSSIWQLTWLPDTPINERE